MGERRGVRWGQQLVTFAGKNRSVSNWWESLTSLTLLPPLKSNSLSSLCPLFPRQRSSHKSGPSCTYQTDKASLCGVFEVHFNNSGVMGTHYHKASDNSDQKEFGFQCLFFLRVPFAPTPLNSKSHYLPH